MKREVKYVSQIKEGNEKCMSSEVR